jgi:hypothetical protein
MSRVFINYRREDCPAHAGRLYDRLTSRLGEAQVFMDIDTIELGVDFTERIREAVDSCDVLIALIGDDWLTVRDGQGRRRLDDPEDFVRMEIVAALRSQKTRVIPVLVEGARMPRAVDLPDELAGLVRRNAIELTDAGWKFEVQHLLDTVEKVIAGEEGQPDKTPVDIPGRPQPRRSLLAVLAGVALVSVGALAVLLFRSEPAPNPPAESNARAEKRSSVLEPPARSSGTARVEDAKQPVYKSEAYRVHYPAGWTVAQDYVQKTDYFETEFVSPNGGQSVKIDHTPGEMTPPATKAAQVEADVRDTPGYQRVSFDEATIGGRSAFAWIFREGDTQKVDYFVNAGGDGYAVLGTSDVRDFRVVLPAARRVAESLRDQ